MDVEGHLIEEAKTIDEELGIEKVHPSYKMIPKFFDPPPRSGDNIQQWLRREAQELEVKKQMKELLDREEMTELWQTLKRHVTEMTPRKEKLINLNNYLDVMFELGARFREFLDVRLFLDLMDDSEYEKQVNIVSIYSYLIREMSLARARVYLSSYDRFGLGYLEESDLELYTVKLVSSRGQVRYHLQPDFEKFFLCTVVKNVFFFLDALHLGRVRISDISSSGLLSKMIELIDGDTDYEKLNYFSLPVIVEVHKMYQDLDKDHNGLLSRKEMSEFGSGGLTTRFLDRAFEVCRTFGGEIDYKTFLEFLLALENRNTSAGMRYIFRILDIYQQGYLTAETLFYFFTEIEDGSQSKYKFQDLKDKILDMVRPQDPLKITLKDLINSGQGGLAVSYLIEFHKFLPDKNCESTSCIK